jgi:glycosyltransferase involved in cell wall biosynthesis
VRLSVVIPAYNAAATTRRAIDSVIAQDFIDREIIVVDDGSTDNTRSILNNYGDKITTIRQANAGQSAALNTAIAAAHGKYLAFLDSDYYWLPGRLRLTVDALDEHPGAGLALCDYMFVDRDDGRTLGVARPGRAPPA